MPDKFGDRIRLQHDLDAIDRIETYINGSSPQDFETDLKLQDACIRQLQIIGEACNRKSPEIQSGYTNISWPQIIGLRNIIIHEYAGIDHEIIWNIIKKDLPVLSNNLNEILLQLPGDEAAE